MRRQQQIVTTEPMGYELMVRIMGRALPMAPITLSRNQEDSIVCAWWPDGRRYVVIGPKHAPMQGPLVVPA